MADPLQKMVADINATAALSGDPEWIAELLRQKRKAAKSKSTKAELKRMRKAAKSKQAKAVLKQMAELTPQQLTVVAELVAGNAVLLNIGGRPYSAKKAGEQYWKVQAAEADSTCHTVDVGAWTCSCPDCSKRGRDCKHVEALRRLLL